MKNKNKQTNKNIQYNMWKLFLMYDVRLFLCNGISLFVLGYWIVLRWVHVGQPKCLSCLFLSFLSMSIRKHHGELARTRCKGGRRRGEGFKWRRFKEQHILIYGPLNEVARTFRFCTNFEYFSLYIDTFIIYLFIFFKKWCVYIQVPYTSPVEEINSKLCFDKLLYM